MAGADKTQEWLALSCAPDGTIVQTLRDDLGLVNESTHLADIVDEGSAGKARKLIEALRTQERVVGWELNVPAGNGAVPLYFAGSSGQESLLILAARDAAGLSALSEEISSTNVEIGSALRTLVAEDRGITAALRRDNELYEELSRLNNELINRERELARESAALERLAAEKNRLVAIAAHDLRNPLTVISSYAGLLKMEATFDDEQRMYLDEIERSARFMVELVEEMLDAARVESGHLDTDFQDIELVEAARHAAVINRIRAERKEISVSFESDMEQVVIRADAIKLRQIINNLVVNAIKFSPVRSAITIRVRSGESLVMLEVEDRGLGIPRDKLTTIFEPFKTLGRAGTAGERSTGLGLTIVKQLADLHQATIEVESEEGKGSVFRVMFPKTAA